MDAGGHPARSSADNSYPAFELSGRRRLPHRRGGGGVPYIVLGVYLNRTCSRVTSASSALGVLNDYALYKSMHSLTAAYYWPVGAASYAKTGKVTKTF